MFLALAMESRRLDKNASSLVESKQGVLTHVRLAESSPDYGYVCFR